MSATPGQHHQRETITVPRPHIAFGTSAIPAGLADATYLRRAAHDLLAGRPIVDEHLKAALVKLVHDAADTIEHDEHIVAASGYYLERDAVNVDIVLVVDPDQRSWRIHREAADPEHRALAYRLAAGWFGNLPASVG